MQANDLSLSIHNPILIYSFLAAYSLMTVGILVYVQAKFRQAGKVLAILQTEWNSAETQHAGFVGKAQEQISKLSAPAQTPAPAAKTVAIKLDTRNQVVAMGKKGFTATEIARTCGLQEGDVEVLLGIARLQK